MTEKQYTYNTKEDILKIALEKYSNIFTLSTNTETGNYYYGDTANGVGCLIGCLLPTTLANNLDVHYHNETIGRLYLIFKNSSTFELDNEDVSILSEIFEKHFNMNNIGIGFLTRLQRVHDLAGSVNEMRKTLNTFVEITNN